jgi:predicted amidohydrolase
VKVAAYQAPLLAPGSFDAIGRIRTQVRRCEDDGVSILCCPEAILGGLADYNDSPSRIALPASRLEAILSPLASRTVKTIAGFTELADDGRLYNSAAIFENGLVTGVYRKLHPAIRRSVYEAGVEVPVFRAGALTFGVVICNDSNFAGPAAQMAAQGATALFVPTNNGLPAAKAGEEIVAEARKADIARAIENGMCVIRADVAGRLNGFLSYGSSEIVAPDGRIVREARRLREDRIVAAIGTRAALSTYPPSRLL